MSTPGPRARIEGPGLLEIESADAWLFAAFELRRRGNGLAGEQRRGGGAASMLAAYARRQQVRFLCTHSRARAFEPCREMPRGSMDVVYVWAVPYALWYGA